MSEMSHPIFCVKLQKTAEGLPRPPFPGALGDKIYQHISQEAWKLWQGQQTILINENRLSLVNAKDREFLKTEMNRFLFGELS